MKCRYSDDDIALYVEGDLKPAEADAVRAHLASCASCLGLHDSLVESQAVLKTLRDEAISPAALASVRSRVFAELSASRMLWPWHRWVYALAGAAFVLIAGVVWVSYFSGEAPPRIAVSVPPAPVAAVAEAEATAGAGDNEGAPLHVETVPRPAPRRHSARTVRAVADSPTVPAPAAADAEPAKPMVVKLLTDDPNITIYWLIEKTSGGSL